MYAEIETRLLNSGKTEGIALRYGLRCKNVVLPGGCRMCSDFVVEPMIGVDDPWEDIQACLDFAAAQSDHALIKIS